MCPLLAVFNEPTPPSLKPAADANAKAQAPRFEVNARGLREQQQPFEALGSNARVVRIKALQGIPDQPTPPEKTLSSRAFRVTQAVGCYPLCVPLKWGSWRKDWQDNEPHLLPAKQLSAWIQTNLYLSRCDAPFSKEDTTLNSVAGACVTCPRRSGFNTSLFADVRATNALTRRASHQGQRPHGP